MFIHAQQKGYKSELRFFLLLKLLFREGKTELNYNDLKFIEFVEQIKSVKTVKKYIRKLIKLKFLNFNLKTGYYSICSFDKLRKTHCWESRLAFPINYSNYYKINAVTGAVIYGYLHKDFWRKVKSKKSVQIKGCTYNFPKPTFNYKKQFAPVSVYGVKEIFDISTTSASRLKNLAKKEEFLKVKHNLNEISNDEAIVLKQTGNTQNLRFIKGQYYLQSIDSVYPLFYFKKRKFLV